MSLRALCCRLYYASTLVLLELVTFHSYVPALHLLRLFYTWLLHSPYTTSEVLRRLLLKIFFLDLPETGYILPSPRNWRVQHLVVMVFWPLRDPVNLISLEGTLSSVSVSDV